MRTRGTVVDEDRLSSCTTCSNASNRGRVGDEALITLLPKKEEEVDLHDFGPISLVHSFAKIIAKILSLRLEPKLDSLVSKIRAHSWKSVLLKRGGRPTLTESVLQSMTVLICCP
jgi:hypothetical protein